MPSRIYVDVDDVLAQTTREIARTVEALFGKRVFFEQLRTFDLAESFGLDASEQAELMEKIHRPDWLEALPPLEGASETLGRWRADAHEVCVVTGRPAGTNPASLHWLERHGMHHSSFDSLDKYARHVGRDAEAHSLTLEALARKRFALAIEDSLDMAVRLADGIAELVLLMDRPWNRSTDAVPPAARDRIVRVRDWEEIRGYPRK